MLSESGPKSRSTRAIIFPSGRAESLGMHLEYRGTSKEIVNRARCL
jgi:hypothetical protein